MTAYTLYLTERLNSGAFDGKPMQERFKDISQEWKDVPDSKKQVRVPPRDFRSTTNESPAIPKIAARRPRTICS
jgi:hypothetical protein